MSGGSSHSDPDSNALNAKSRRPAATSPENALGDGGLVDLVDRGLQFLVELFVALLGSQVLGKRAAEGSDQAVVLSELITGLVPAVPAGQGDDAHRLWVF